MKAENIKIGYFVGLEYYDVDDAIIQAIWAERCGFDSLWLGDHFHPWHPSGNCSMAWVVLPVIAERTKTISPIGTNVTCPCYRYNPAVVAQAFSTLGRIYPGRIALGVGSGEAMNEIPTTGVWPSPKERLERLIEAVKVIRMLWESDKPVTFKGKYYQLRKAKLYTKPIKRIPLYIAGSGKRSSELAGMYGDHWITTSMSPELLKNVIVPSFERGAEKAGKDPKAMERVLVLDFSIDKDIKKAIESIKPFAASLIPAAFKYGIYDPEELAENGSVVGFEAMKRFWIVTDSVEEMIDRLEEYIKAGINHFALFNLSPNVKETTRLVSEKVIPCFK